MTTVAQPLGNGNTHGVRTYTDTTSNGTTAYKYQIVAENVVGYGSGMPSMTVSSSTAVLGVNVPTAPTGLAATLAGTGAAPRVNLTWQDTATERGAVHRPAVQLTTVRPSPSSPLSAPKTGTGSVTYADTTVALNSSYVYRVAADNVAGTSAWSNPVTVRVAAPAAPVILTGTAVRAGSNERATITWAAVPFATSYVIQWSTNPHVRHRITAVHRAPGAVTTYTTGNIADAKLVLPDGRA